MRETSSDEYIQHYITIRSIQAELRDIGLFGSNHGKDVIKRILKIDDY